MKKSNLQTGDIVLLRNGKKYIVLKDTKVSGDIEDILVSLEDGCYLCFRYYNENLKDNGGDDKFDIMKVCSHSYVGDNIRDHILYSREKWTWERQAVKEMTVDEISKELGYEVKVVGLK